MCQETGPIRLKRWNTSRHRFLICICSFIKFMKVIFLLRGHFAIWCSNFDHLNLRCHHCPLTHGAQGPWQEVHHRLLIITERRIQHYWKRENLFTCVGLVYFTNNNSLSADISFLLLASDFTPHCLYSIYLPRANIHYSILNSILKSTYSSWNESSYDHKHLI